MSRAIVTPEATLCFPALFEPKPQSNEPNAPLKYQATLVFPANADFGLIKKMIAEAIEFKWGNKKPGNLRMPIRSGEEDAYRDKKGFGPGTVFIAARANQDQPPHIVDRDANPIIDQREIYPGCKVLASITAYAYDKNGNKGVAFALNGIQKVKDGDRLDGRPDPSSMFNALAGAGATGGQSASSLLDELNG